ncbi:hypothetical protein TNCV_1394161, partial [Trichonephila clavipes]
MVQPTEVTHSTFPLTNHSACFPRPVHSNKSWFPHRLSTSTPSTSYHHVIYYVTPAANQVAACFPSRFSTTTGHIHFRVPTEERFAFHVPVNHTQS